MTRLADIGAVDMHAHYVPPTYRRALADAGIDRPERWRKSGARPTTSKPTASS